MTGLGPKYFIFKSDLTFARWIKANKLRPEEPSDGRRVQLKILRVRQARGGGGAPVRAVV